MEVFFIANNSKEVLINEAIREKEVRVVDATGQQLGIMSSRQALELVNIAPHAKPPVCRIMDYGKYRYEQAKREKEARKNQKTIEVKEVRMNLNIDDHDLNTKINNAIKFLKAGNKVKVSVRFRGREMAHQELGRALLERFQQACADYGTVDKPAKMEGRSLSMFMVDKTKK